jgi:hypothetical protein
MRRLITQMRQVAAKAGDPEAAPSLHAANRPAQAVEHL